MSTFVLLVCSDIVGHKQNVEIPFATPPTLAELKQRADQVFYEEAQALSRQGRLTAAASELLATTVTAPGFDGRGVYNDSGLLSLGRVQVYDDSLMRWVDLVSPSQLHEYDQVYIFPKHRAHLSQVRDLPPPQPTGTALYRKEVGNAAYETANTTSNMNVTARSVGGNAGPSGSMQMSSQSPPRHSVVAPNRSIVGGSEQSPSRHMTNNYNNSRAVVGFAAHDQQARAFDLNVEELDRRQRQVFSVADSDGNSYLTLDEFRVLFSRTKILFNDVTITELFAMHAHNGRFMTFAEWQLFARHFPQLFTAMHRRLTETQTETDMSNELELGAKRLMGLREEAEDLARRLEECRQNIHQQETRSKEVADHLAATRSERVPVEEEEQVVLEKEVRVHFQREMLTREETELKTASKRLDERAAVHAHQRGDVRRF